MKIKQVLVLTLSLLTVSSCKKSDPLYCTKTGDCRGGLICDVRTAECVAPDPQGEVPSADGGSRRDVTVPGTRLDTGGMVMFGDGASATTGEPAVRDGAVSDRRAEGDARVEVDVPKVACTTTAQCVPGAPLCSPAGMCTGCRGDSDCMGLGDATRMACSPSGACVRCVQDTHCGAGNPVCDGASNTCVECTMASQCSGKAPLCEARKCAGCGTDAQCLALDDPARRACGKSGACVRCAADAHCGGTATPVCDTATNMCVQCTSNGQCAGSTPVCEANKCGACKVDTQCQGLNDPNRRACGKSGACVRCAADSHCTGSATPACDVPTNLCVECIGDANCTTDPTKSFCVANKCDSCAKVAPQACATRGAAKPVCGAGGACVECNASADCSRDVGKPICTASACGRCTTDAQCAAKGGGPGVCMDHQDGRCASEAETIYVQKGGACGGTAGTAAVPLCGPQEAAAALTGGRRVVVVRGAVDELNWTLNGPQVSVVGQPSGGVAATIAAGTSPGISISGGDIYVRSLSISCVADVSDRGIVAQSGTVLRLNRVAVKNCAKGGIFVDVSGFDIRNTTVTGNGPGDLGGLPWGGIRVQAFPPAGPSRLESLTIKDNKGPGLSCTSAAMGSGVLASGNSPTDISSSCGVTACGAAGPNCGAQ